MSARPDRTQRAGARDAVAVHLAVAAAVVGGLYAAVSAYWAFGGSGLLDTVSSTLAGHGRAAGQGAVAAAGAAAILKLFAALVPLRAVQQRRRARHRRATELLAWMAALILSAYGLILTTAGLLLQAGVIEASPTADRRALAWHAYFWDPWFLLWGILITLALARRPERPGPAS